MRPIVRLLVVLGSTCIVFPLAARVAECRAGASAQWTAIERAAWNDLCERKVAVVGTKAARGVVRADFIEEILLDPSYSKLLPHRGVRIAFADVRGALHLGNAHIPHELWLDDSVLRDDVDFYNAELAHSLSLEGSILHGKLRLPNARVANQVQLSGAEIFGRVDMESAVIERNLFMNGAHFHGPVHLRRLSAGDQVTAIRSTFVHDLTLDGARIEGLLLLHALTAKELVLRGAVIGDSLAIDGKSSIDNLSADNLAVTRTFRLRAVDARGRVKVIRLRGLTAGVADLGNIDADTVDLEGARIGGALDVHGFSASRFAAPFVQLQGRLLLKDSRFGKVDLRGARMWHVELHGTTVETDFAAPFANIDDGFTVAEKVTIGGKLDLRSLRADALDLSGGTYSIVDLARANLRSYLSVGGIEQKARWRDGGSLSLVYARADALHDHQNAWPKRLALDGFVYDRWGTLEPFRPALAAGATDFVDFRRRDDGWFRTWLDAQEQFSAQSYLQLASAFRRAGLDERAIDFQYAARERERVHTSGLKYIALTTSKALTGYGFRYERSLYWVAFFVACGWLVLRASGQWRHGDAVIGLAYSLDMFLPIVQLRKKHEEVDLKPPVRYYFYVHRLAGFVIGTFVLAALAGFR